MSWRILNTVNLSGAPEAVAVLEEVGELITLRPHRAEVLAGIGNCHAYLANAAVQIDREFLVRANNLRIIGSPSTGIDHMDISSIRERGITCFDIAKEFELLSGFTATSELVFALSLALARNLIPATTAAENADWARERFAGFQLFEKTFGIMGLGRLGSISARIALGFGMKVIATDIEHRDLPGVKMVEFDELLESADILSVHIHLKDDTRNIIDAASMARMKPSALLINTSRGAIIDEPALLNALETGQIAGAGLDVIDGEWLSSDELAAHPLIAYAKTHENLIVAPHIGGSTTESINGARIFMARKIADALRILEIREPGIAS